MKKYSDPSECVSTCIVKVDKTAEFESMFGLEYETETLYHEQRTYLWRSNKVKDTYRELNFE